MTAKEAMNRNLVTVSVGSSVQEAASKMRDQHVGSVLVIEDGMSLRGLITDRDIALQVAAGNKDSKSTSVSEIMSSNPVTCDANASIDDAIKIMSRAHVMRIPVMDDGKVAGILSLADLAPIVKNQIDEFMTLEEVCLKGQI